MYEKDATCPGCGCRYVSALSDATPYCSATCRWNAGIPDPPPPPRA